MVEYHFLLYGPWPGLYVCLAIPIGEVRFLIGLGVFLSRLLRIPKKILGFPSEMHYFQ